MSNTGAVPSPVLQNARKVSILSTSVAKATERARSAVIPA